MHPATPSTSTEPSATPTNEVQEDEELDIYIVKSTEDEWPEKDNVTFASLKKRVKDKKYKTCHNGMIRTQALL